MKQFWPFSVWSPNRRHFYRENRKKRSLFDICSFLQCTKKTFSMINFKVFSDFLKIILLYIWNRVNHTLNALSQSWKKNSFLKSNITGGFGYFYRVSYGFLVHWWIFSWSLKIFWSWFLTFVLYFINLNCDKKITFGYQCIVIMLIKYLYKFSCLMRCM